MKRRRGRPLGPVKQVISVRLDEEHRELYREWAANLNISRKLLLERILIGHAAGMNDEELVTFIEQPGQTSRFSLSHRLSRMQAQHKVRALAVSLETFTIDHILPLDKRGPHVADNLQPAHRWCNSRKGTS